MDNLIRVGVISSTHGVKGEVKVFPTTDNVEHFRKIKEIILDTGKEQISLEIQGVKFFKQMVILKFKGIDNINDIEKYKGKDLLIHKENAAKLQEGEYFIFDLVGCTVHDEENVELGELTEVLKTGANDVYVVKGKNGKEILLPVIKDCILQVDIENKKIKVHVLPGLLE